MVSSLCSLLLLDVVGRVGVESVECKVALV
jgi:hypothetical protein